MRYPAAEKLEIIQLVEQSHLPVRRSLEQIGIPKSTFYRWCDLYQPFDPHKYVVVREELSRRFGGITAFTRAPAEGSSHAKYRGT